MSLKNLLLLILFTSGCSGNKILNLVKGRVDKILDASGGNTQCAHDLKKLMSGLLFREHWAISMIDANAKIQPGLLFGNLYQYGNFDQCLNISHSTKTSHIKGQYCTVLVLPSIQFKSDYNFILDLKGISDFHGVNVSYHSADILRLLRLTFGICIPNSCSISNLQSIWDYLEHMFGISFHMHFFDVTCRHVDKPIDPSPMDKYVYLFFAIVIVLLIACTLYEVLIHQTKSNPPKQDNIMVCFSLYSNFKYLIGDKSIGEDSSLTCLSGMKVISMFWIIHGHRVVCNLFAGSSSDFQQWQANPLNAYIIGGSFSVDTYLALSGLLVMFTYLKFTDYNPHQSFSFLAFYTYRFLRLTPALLATILFYISVLKSLSDGPLWPIVMKKIVFGCRNYWWATILFLTNFVKLEHQCVEQSWYLAVDSQLYFISPLILLNIRRYPRLVFGAMLALGIATSLYAYIITVKNHYGALYFQGNIEYHEKIYQPVHLRLNAWLVGVMFGYLIYYYKQVKISKYLNMVIWTICLSILIFIQYIHTPLGISEYDPVIAGLFNSLTRPIWAFAVTTIVYLCVTDHGGLINKFLSCNIFKLLSKLTYSMYLTHLGVLAYMVASRRHPEHFSTFNCIHDFFGDLILIVLVSTVTCLSFEYPMIRIARMLLKKSTMANQRQSKATNTEELQKKKYLVSITDVDTLDAEEKGKLKLS